MWRSGGGAPLPPRPARPGAAVSRAHVRGWHEAPPCASCRMPIPSGTSPSAAVRQRTEKDGSSSRNEWRPEPKGSGAQTLHRPMDGAFRGWQTRCAVRHLCFARPPTYIYELENQLTWAASTAASLGEVRGACRGARLGRGARHTGRTAQTGRRLQCRPSLRWVPP